MCLLYGELLPMVTMIGISKEKEAMMACDDKWSFADGPVD
jgi:hypothetical protein